MEEPGGLLSMGSHRVRHYWSDLAVSYPVPCGILVPQPGIDPESPGLEGEFLTTGPPGKSGTSIAFVAIEVDEADLCKDKDFQDIG